jgi:hypothetical protein
MHGQAADRIPGHVKGAMGINRKVDTEIFIENVGGCGIRETED